MKRQKNAVGVSSASLDIPGELYKKTKKSKYAAGIKPRTPLEWVSLADDFVEWAKLEASLVFEDFPTSKNYSPSRFKRWTDDDYFVEALEIGQAMLSARREKIALQDGPGTMFILKTYHLYNKEAAEWEREKWSKDSTNGPAKIITVEIPTYMSAEEYEKQKGFLATANRDKTS
jgi:hypothetical protein